MKKIFLRIIFSFLLAFASSGKIFSQDSAPSDSTKNRDTVPQVSLLRANLFYFQIPKQDFLWGKKIYLSYERIFSNKFSLQLAGEIPTVNVINEHSAIEYSVFTQINYNLRLFRFDIHEFFLKPGVGVTHIFEDRPGYNDGLSYFNSHNTALRFDLGLRCIVGYAYLELGYTYYVAPFSNHDHLNFYSAQARIGFTF